MKYKEWLEEWLDNYIKPTAKERTYTRYYEIVHQHISPHLGEYELNDLTPIVIQKFVPYQMKDLEYYEEFYDEVILPLSPATHFKSAITKRNEWLVENSELLIAYVLNESGGAYQCVKKAQQHSREILFLCRDS